MVLLWCDCYKAEFCLLCNCPDVELGPSTYTNYSLPLFGGGGDIGGCNRRGD